MLCSFNTDHDLVFGIILLNYGFSPNGVVKHTHRFGSGS